MPTLTIRNVPAEDVAKLKARAKANNRSLEAELREIVSRSATMPPEEFWRRADAIAERTRGRIHGDSADLIREERDQR